jgi:hypothetical protein
MGVACGPGFPLQVLAFPARDSDARCGFFTTIPNAAPHALSLIYILHVIMIFFRVSLMDTRNDDSLLRA